MVRQIVRAKMDMDALQEFPHFAAIEVTSPGCPPGTLALHKVQTALIVIIHYAVSPATILKQGNKCPDRPVHSSVIRLLSQILHPLFPPAFWVASFSF